MLTDGSVRRRWARRRSVAVFGTAVLVGAGALWFVRYGPTGLFFLEGLFRIVSFLAAGLLMQAEVWQAYLLGLPFALAALYGGSHAHTGVSDAQMTRIGALLLLSSLSVFVKAGGLCLSPTRPRRGFPGWGARSDAQQMVTLSQAARQADRPKATPRRVCTKMPICGVALLGFVCSIRPSSRA